MYANGKHPLPFCDGLANTRSEEQYRSRNTKHSSRHPMLLNSNFTGIHSLGHVALQPEFKILSTDERSLQDNLRRLIGINGLTGAFVLVGGGTRLTLAFGNCCVRATLLVGVFEDKINVF